MPRVSILMPTHNRADVVGLAIRSVLAQTETDFELLVVADGCTDGTVEVVSSCADPRIRLFDLPKAPHFGYANRNVALRESRGEFLAFAAHDDLLFPDHLTRLVATLDSNGAEWAYSRPLWVSTDGCVVPFATNLQLSDELEAFLTTGNTIPASCVVFRRSCLDRYGYWPESVPGAADWRYWVAIIEGGRRRNLAYEPTPTTLHFSADWKASRHSGMPEVLTWLEIADRAPWWPAALRYDVPPGVPEQQVLADIMQNAGEAWMAAVRAAVATVIDRVAWDAIRVGRPRLRAIEAEQRALVAHVQVVERALEEARGLAEANQADAAELERVRRSHSWRLTAPLRAWRRRLAARGASPGEHRDR